MYNYLAGGCKEDKARLSLVVPSEHKRDNGYELKYKKILFKITRKSFFLLRVAEHWSRLLSISIQRLQSLYFRRYQIPTSQRPYQSSWADPALSRMVQQRHSPEVSPTSCVLWFCPPLMLKGSAYSRIWVERLALTLGLTWSPLLPVQTAQFVCNCLFIHLRQTPRKIQSAGCIWFPSSTEDSGTNSHSKYIPRITSIMEITHVWSLVPASLYLLFSSSISIFTEEWLSWNCWVISQTID